MSARCAYVRQVYNSLAIRMRCVGCAFSYIQFVGLPGEPSCGNLTRAHISPADYHPFGSVTCARIPQVHLCLEA
eukprot:5437063-Pyramimonas_sp.AAC.1